MTEAKNIVTSAKKLKQAQLSFTVRNPATEKAKDASGSTIKMSELGSSSDEDKENMPLSNKQPSPDLSSSSKEVLMIDLTEDISDVKDKSEAPAKNQAKDLKPGTSSMSDALNQSIDDVIEEVVQRAALEHPGHLDNRLTPQGNASAKKKRRRSKSTSPIPPQAKRPILNDGIQEKGRDGDKGASNDAMNCEVPAIKIIPATPVEKPKRTTKRESILSFLGSPKPLSVDEKTVENTAAEKEEKFVASPAPACAGNLAGKKRRRSGRQYASPVKIESIEISDSEESTSHSSTPATSKKLKKINISESPTLSAKDIDKDTHQNTNDKADLSKSQEKEDSSALDSESMSSPTTSKTMNFNQDTPSPPENKVSPKSGTKKQRPLSLEAQLKKEERERDKEEKRKQKLELKRKRDEEKAQKDEERRKKKEEEERIKIEKLKKLEEKQREKEQKELEKKKEREKKEEEKRKEKEKKEEERKLRELEKQRIDDEKLQAEEEKKFKKEKRAENFKSFFKSPARSPSVKKPSKQIGIFVPFQLKKDMMLAPLCRAVLDSSRKELLEERFEKQGFSKSYLNEIKGKSFPKREKPKSRRKVVSLSEDGLEVIENGESAPGAKMLHAKFLSFHDNIRPAYYGTWTKTSNCLSAKNPYKKDKDIFDYEFDSDDEWEDPGDAEDLANSDGEDEEGNEEDEDDGFFVPHGYLSDDEGINEEVNEDGEEAKTDHKLKQKQLEFEASFKRKLSALTPVVIGCIWKDTSESVNKVHKQMLEKYKMQVIGSSPIEIFPSNNNDKSAKVTPKSDPPKNPYGIKAVPEEAMYDLIRLLHGNALSLTRIINEFREYMKLKKDSDDGSLAYGPVSLEPTVEDEEMECTESLNNSDQMKNHPQNTTMPENSSAPTSGRNSPTEGIQTTPGTSKNVRHTISKTQLMKRCKEIATYCKRDNINRSCWFVHETVLENYDLGNGTAPIPCKWNYVTEVPKIQILIYPQNNQKASQPLDAVTPTQSPAPNIVKFVAKVSAKDILEKSKLKHERDKQQQVTTTAAPAPKPSIAKFTIDKLSPVVLIEKSAQKIAEDIAIKNKRLEEIAAAALANAHEKQLEQVQEGVYIIPTPEAIRSLFKIEPTEEKIQLNAEKTTDMPADGNIGKENEMIKPELMVE